jgi:glycosyltransferase involved in cell wall biosynthesis
MAKLIESLTVFFPAYNEEKNIAQCIESAKKTLKKYAQKWEILVIVYEGSIDKTIDVVTAYQTKDKRIRLILQPKEQKGVGTAYLLGFKNAKYDAVFYSDSDNQFDITELKRFIPYIGDFDIIAGYRINRQDPTARIWTSKLYNFFLRQLFPIKERDVDCAFRCVNKKIFNSFSIVSTTGLMTAEMLAKARIAGYKITQIGVSHYPRTAGEACFEMPAGLNVPKPKVVWEIVKEIIHLRKDIADFKRKCHYSSHKKRGGIQTAMKTIKNNALIFWHAVLFRRCPLCQSPILEKDYPEELTQYGICTNEHCTWGKH